jgi:hypothetical protein
MLLDVFIKSTDTVKVDEICRDLESGKYVTPVAIYNDKEDPHLMGYHIKCDASVYKAAQLKHSGKVYTWQDVGAKFKRNDKFAFHIFGPGAPIVDSLDTDDPDKFVTFDQNSEDGWDMLREEKYKCVNGKLEKEPKV